MAVNLAISSLSAEKRMAPTLVDFARELRAGSDLTEKPLKHLQEERASATGEVEHRHAPIVGQPICKPKALFKNVVYRAHNEINDGRRRTKTRESVTVFHLVTEAIGGRAVE